MHLPRAAWQVTSQIQCCLCLDVLTSNLDECVWHDTMSRWVQPHCITGHAVPFCRNMWEFTLRRCNNKGRSPPAVDCSTDGYLWRGFNGAVCSTTHSSFCQPQMTCSCFCMYDSASCLFGRECARLLSVLKCRFESANATDFHSCCSNAYFVFRHEIRSLILGYVL